MSERVSVISVSYNSAAVLGGMLASIPPSATTIIVDNNSSDASASLADDHADTVLRLTENQGFGRACNAGAAVARTDYLLFLNPDTVAEPGAIAELVRVMDARPDASACNPKMFEEDGRPHFKRRSILLAPGQAEPRGWPADTRAVCILSGAALFVRRAAFEAVGGFDPDIFLYHEDDDLALRLRAACGPLLFVATAEVKHLGGASTERSPQSAAFKAYHLARSRVYALAKHGRPMPFARSLMAAVLKCLSPFVILSRRKRAQAGAFLRGVWSMRRGGPASWPRRSGQ